MSWLSSSLPSWFPLLPLLVFVAEICVVTISTVRIIYLSRGRKVLASVLGFFEVTIWLFAIGQIMQNLSNLGCYLAFASGFSLGNFLGVLIEQKLAIGNSVVRIITSKDPSQLIEELKTAQLGVTTIDGEGATGPVKIVMSVIKRKELRHVLSMIKNYDSRAFYSISDLQEAAEGIFPLGRGSAKGVIPFLPIRLSRSAA